MASINETIQEIDNIINTAQGRIEGIEADIKNLPKDKGPAPELKPDWAGPTRQPGTMAQRTAGMQDQITQIKAQAKTDTDKLITTLPQEYQSQISEGVDKRLNPDKYPTTEKKFSDNKEDITGNKGGKSEGTTEKKFANNKEDITGNKGDGKSQEKQAGGHDKNGSTQGRGENTPSRFSEGLSYSKHEGQEKQSGDPSMDNSNLSKQNEGNQTKDDTDLKQFADNKEDVTSSKGDKSEQTTEKKFANNKEDITDNKSDSQPQEKHGGDQDKNDGTQGRGGNSQSRFSDGLSYSKHEAQKRDGNDPSRDNTEVSKEGNVDQSKDDTRISKQDAGDNSRNDAGPSKEETGDQSKNDIQAPNQDGGDKGNEGSGSSRYTQSLSYTQQTEQPSTPDIKAPEKSTPTAPSTPSTPSKED